MKISERIIDQRKKLQDELTANEKEAGQIHREYLAQYRKKGRRLEARRLPNNITKKFPPNYVCKDVNKRKEMRIIYNSLILRNEAIKQDMIIMDEAIHQEKVNEYRGVSQSKQKLISKIGSKSVDTRIHDIIPFISAWKNIEIQGSYSDSKLAQKLNMNRSTLSRWFEKEIIRDGNKKTAKQLLISKLREAIRIAEEKEKHEIKLRLKCFHDYLTGEIEIKDRSRGRRKTDLCKQI